MIELSLSRIDSTRALLAAAAPHEWVGDVEFEAEFRELDEEFDAVVAVCV